MIGKKLFFRLLKEYGIYYIFLGEVKKRHGYNIFEKILNSNLYDTYSISIMLSGLFIYTNTKQGVNFWEKHIMNICNILKKYNRTTLLMNQEINSIEVNNIINDIKMLKK